MGLLTPQITRPLFGEGGGAGNEATNPTLHTGTSLHVHSHTDVTLIHPTICTHILSSQKQTLQTLMHPPHPIPCTLTHPHIVPFQLQHIASFPDLPQLQFLIACSLQIKLEAGKASTQQCQHILSLIHTTHTHHMCTPLTLTYAQTQHTLKFQSCAYHPLHIHQSIRLHNPHIHTLTQPKCAYVHRIVHISTR